MRSLLMLGVMLPSPALALGNSDLQGEVFERLPAKTAERMQINGASA